MESHNTHGWIISALLREMSGLENQAMFECVESNFFFNRCLRQGRVEAPRLWQKMAMQLLANVEDSWTRKRVGILLDLERQKVPSDVEFYAARQLPDHVPLQKSSGTDVA